MSEAKMNLSLDDIISKRKGKGGKPGAFKGNKGTFVRGGIALRGARGFRGGRGAIGGIGARGGRIRGSFRLRPEARDARVNRNGTQQFRQNRLQNSRMRFRGRGSNLPQRFNNRQQRQVCN